MTCKLCNRTDATGYVEVGHERFVCFACRRARPAEAEPVRVDQIAHAVVARRKADVQRDMFGFVDDAEVRQRLAKWRE